jgi:hypothetical protein
MNGANVARTSILLPRAIDIRDNPLAYAGTGELAILVDRWSGIMTPWT